MNVKEREVVSSFITLWAETNQKIMRQMADLSLAAVAESFRLAGEVQSALAQSAGRLQHSAGEASSRIRDEVGSAMSEAQRLSTPARS